MYHPTIVMGWAMEKDRRRAMLKRSDMFASSAMTKDTALMAINLHLHVDQHGTQHNIVAVLRTRRDQGHRFHALQFPQVVLKPSSAGLRRRC